MKARSGTASVAVISSPNQVSEKKKDLDDDFFPITKGKRPTTAAIKIGGLSKKLMTSVV